MGSNVRTILLQDTDPNSEFGRWRPGLVHHSLAAIVPNTRRPSAQETQEMLLRPSIRMSYRGGSTSQCCRPSHTYGGRRVVLATARTSMQDHPAYQDLGQVHYWRWPWQH